MSSEKNINLYRQNENHKPLFRIMNAKKTTSLQHMNR